MAYTEPPAEKLIDVSVKVFDADTGMWLYCASREQIDAAAGTDDRCIWVDAEGTPTAVAGEMQDPDADTHFFGAELPSTTVAVDADGAIRRDLSKVRVGPVA